MIIRTTRLALMCAALFCVSVFAKDMVLTTLDGQKIVLHEDNTWTFESGKKGEIDRDFTVPVNGGKIVLIATDGTWGFAEKEIVNQEELVKTDSVVGNGHSINKDVTAANAEAQRQALAQVTARMKSCAGQAQDRRCQTVRLRQAR